MSTTAAVQRTLPTALPLDDRRGTGGMLLFITTEALLFLIFFFSYFYLGHREPRWPMDEPPKLMLASIMLVVLVGSSVVLHAGERAARGGRDGVARAWVLATIVMGLAFLVLQTLEYRDHLKTLKPTTDAYGSIFYTITGFHAAHVVLGLLMLAYVLVLPRVEHTDRAPFRPLHNASLYWHFVDGVWVVIVALLYVMPNLVR